MGPGEFPESCQQPDGLWQLHQGHQHPEEYINNANQPGVSNFNQVTSHYLLTTDAAMTTPSIQVNNGFYNTAGYVDFSNPSARAWWFTKGQTPLRR